MILYTSLQQNFLSTFPKTLNEIHDALNNCYLITDYGKHILFVNVI